MKKRRGRGRPAGKPLSRRELAARRANLAKARRAPKDVIYRPTAKRLAASLANLRQAMAARRSEEASERVRLNALKHGVYSRELVDESVRRLGESEREFQAHRELFVQLLVPRDEGEAALVLEMANLAWRRLRLFRAQAQREARDLGRMLAGYPEPAPLDAAETLDRMYMLFATLDNCDRVLKDASKLRFEMQGLIQMLIARRAPPEPQKIETAGHVAPEGQRLESEDLAESPAPARQALDDPFSDLEISSESN